MVIPGTAKRRARNLIRHWLTLWEFPQEAVAKCPNYGRDSPIGADST